MDDPDLDDGWTPTAADTEPDEVRYMSNVDLVPDITHPVRGTIMRRLRRPRTVAQLADDLDAPITRLYHHVNRLEDLGLIRVVATRRVGAATERRYQVTARSWKLAEDAFESLDPRELSGALGSLFDVAKIGLQREIEAGAFHATAPEDQFTLSLGEVRLTTTRRRELSRRLQEVIEDFGTDAEDDEPDAVVTTLFIAAYPES